MLRASMLVIGICVATSGSAQDQGGLLGRFKPAELGTLDANGAYQLSAEEQGYDCKKLTGRMQLRLLQVRDNDVRDRATGLSRGIQSVTSSLFGSSSAGSGLDTKHKTDIAMLEAYNARLKSKKCRSFDLGAELKPKSVTETPTAR